MIYSSLMFIYVFLPLTLLAYYAVPPRYKELSLLSASLVFCALGSLYFLLFVSAYVLLNYFMCRITGFLKRKKSIAEVAFASTLIIDIIVLFSFRAPYLNWFAAMIRVPEGFFPVGISIMTLSAVGMLYDVYTGKGTAETNIIRYSLYLIFFPRLIIGPVLRYSSFRRILDKRRFSIDETGKGLALFVRGFAKKVLLADNLYMLYSAVKSMDASDTPLVTAWLGMIACLLCLYYSLSGFADMGRGLAGCFGYHFPKCFNYPVFRKKVRYFSEKWNSPVVMWFRRYILRPLTVSLKGIPAKTAVFLISWSILGFWYSFTIGGFIAGLVLGIAMKTEERFKSKNLLSITGIIYTFSVSMIFTSFLCSDSPALSVKNIGCMLGAEGFADSLSLYLLKKYIVILIAAAFGSTSILHRFMHITEKSRFRKILSYFTPAAVLGLLIICTAITAYSGVSDYLILKL